MAEKRESGVHRQERIQEEQHRPEQNAGYDEAARGGKDVPPSDVGVPLNPNETAGGDEFDQEAREAANEVRRHDRSAN